jgi:thiol-disulfide isomerase/thioredoxin
MKKFLVAVSVLVILWGCGQQKEQTQLILNLKNAGFDEAVLTIIKDHINNNELTVQAPVNEEGLFVFHVDLPHSQMVYLTLGERRKGIFLGKGGTLHMEADMEDWDATLSFTGDFSAENTFILENSKIMEAEYGQRELMTIFRNGNAVELDEFLNNRYTATMQSMEDFHAAQPLSEDYRYYFSTHSKYTRYLYKLYYNHQSEVPEGFYDFITDALAFTDNDLKVPVFASFLTAYLEYHVKSNAEAFSPDLTSFEKKLHTTSDIYSGKIQDFVIADMINDEMIMGDFKAAEDQYLQFRDAGKNAEYVAVLQQTYEDVLRIQPGNPAPAFTLQDMEGNEVSLADFKGKVVYLDFWASWCGPCMREVPHAKELKKRFQGQDDLVFLYVSVDDDMDAWKRTVETHAISGIHLFSKGWKSDIVKQYNVKGVPTFLIIDREGIIHNNKPGRPSSGDVIDEQLRTVLNMEV